MTSSVPHDEATPSAKTAKSAATKPGVTSSVAKSPSLANSVPPEFKKSASKILRPRTLGQQNRSPRRLLPLARFRWV